MDFVTICTCPRITYFNDFWIAVGADLTVYLSDLVSGACRLMAYRNDFVSAVAFRVVYLNDLVSAPCFRIAYRIDFVRYAGVVFTVYFNDFVTETGRLIS
jgi:hypothetical protein